eukprot:8130436-Alexandrium_andersonii.AAC.1
MSASLVGSEMCIRDSLGPLPGETQLGRTTHTRGLQRPLSPPSRALAPVSYTHLTLPTICSV